MAQRVTLRKRQPYNTKSNRRRVVKTPGGKTVYHHIKKLATAPKCGDCELKLPGVRATRFRNRPSNRYGHLLDLAVAVHLWLIDPCSPTA
jgi:hypothetical protein